MQYELTGRLVFKTETVQRTEKFAVREFVVEVTEEVRDKTYSQLIKFQASNERTAVLDDINIGYEVKVHFNLRGSKWEKDGKTSYFTNLDAWKIEKLHSAEPAKKEEFITEAEVVEEPADDLPF
jgi:hypothetical protein